MKLARLPNLRKSLRFLMSFISCSVSGEVALLLDAERKLSLSRDADFFLAGDCSGGVVCCCAVAVLA